MIYYRGMINYKLKQFVTFCLLPFTICVLLFSCHDKTETLNIDYKYSYFPLDTGHYVTYDVDSISSYNSNHTKDTAHYQLKELVTDTFYDNLNELTYELTLFRRETSVSPWVFDRKWYTKRTQYNAQKTEDDIRFVKLVFPPIPTGTWDGNLYVPTTDPYRNFQNWDYHYESVDVPYSINGFNFDSSLTAVDVDDATFIEKRLRKEVYVKHIGLVYQEWELKSKATVTSWDTGQWSGFSIRMRLIDHN